MNNIKTLDLKANDKVNIIVRWPTLKAVVAENEHIALDGAEIIIIDNSSGLQIKTDYKHLNNGSVSFKVPNEGAISNFSFNAEIIARHTTENNAIFEVCDEKGELVSSGFNSLMDGGKFSFTKVSDTEWTVEYEIKEDESKEDGVWSVFQATKCMYDSAYDNLKYILTGNLLINTFQSETHFNGATKLYSYINLKYGDHRAWHIIAHEISHYIFYNSDSVEREGGNHNRKINQYDNPESLITYHKKRESMAFVFSEGCATWLGKSLLNLSKYKDGNNKLGNIGDSLYDQYNLDKTVQDITDSVKGELILYPTPFGEDAEISIIRLLWNITNKEGSKSIFERIEPKGEITNKVRIKLKELFENVFNGKKLKNISDFYQKLFNYYVYENKSSLSDSNLLDVKLDELTKISELGNLFAECSGQAKADTLI